MRHFERNSSESVDYDSIATLWLLKCVNKSLF